MSGGNGFVGAMRHEQTSLVAAILLWITTAFALPGSFGAFSTWISSYAGGGPGSPAPYTNTTTVTGWTVFTEPSTTDRPTFATAAVGIPFTVGAALAAVACLLLLLARGRAGDPLRIRLLGMFAAALVAGTVVMVVADQGTQLLNHIIREAGTGESSFSTDLVLGTGFWLVVAAAAMGVSAIGLLAVPAPPPAAPVRPVRLAAVPLVLLAGLTIAGSLLPQVIRELGESNDRVTVVVNSWATAELDSRGALVPTEDIFPPYWLAAVLGALIVMIAAGLAFGSRPVGARMLGVVGSGVTLGYCSFELLSTVASAVHLAFRNEGAEDPEIYTIAAGTWVLVAVAVIAVATTVLLIVSSRPPRPVSAGAPVHGYGVRTA
ncbi:hypothetical protein [Pseudonocardia sp. TRM90224]|uniref:hypothetical protein n=1 Tax=Pseudonocardia sp. TRM90224 TaxID=2812678 RepID=UPI001E2A7922|nr:hypothetical protein [Pseudonocardia sp. TRM90224]